MEREGLSETAAAAAAEWQETKIMETLGWRRKGNTDAFEIRRREDGEKKERKRQKTRMTNIQEQQQD